MFRSPLAPLSASFFAAMCVACTPAGTGMTPVAAEDGGRTTTTPPPFTGTDAGAPHRPTGSTVDSDNDGLPDDEELARGTNISMEDTDGDGVGDGVEVLAGTDPTSASSTIPPTDFYMVLPYESPVELRELDFQARLGKGDIFFLVDTTGSMAAAINSVRTSLSSTIVPAIEGSIADLVMGVGDYRDFPIGDYGSSGDWPFVLRQAMTADIPSVQSALNALRAFGGGDGPESMVEGLYESVRGGSCSSGFGLACFRDSSHPIIVVVTDAPAHNGPGGNNYDSTVPMARTWSETVDALNAANVKTVGAAVLPIALPFPIPIDPESLDDLEDLARATDSRSSGGRLTVYDSPGGEVDAAIVDGIVDLVGAETQDVTSRQIDDTSDTVDATRFIRSIRPVRATRATRFDDSAFYGVAGGTAVTFEVAFENNFLPQEDFVQIFLAQIEVHDLPGMTALDVRNVYIVVPAVGGILI